MMCMIMFNAAEGNSSIDREMMVCSLLSCKVVYVFNYLSICSSIPSYVGVLTMNVLIIIYIYIYIFVFLMSLKNITVIRGRMLFLVGGI